MCPRILLLFLAVAFTHSAPLGDFERPSVLSRQLKLDDDNYLEVFIALSARIVTPEVAAAEADAAALRRRNDDDQLVEALLGSSRRGERRYMMDKEGPF